MWVVEVKDCFGSWYGTGVRYADKSRAIAMARYYRLGMSKGIVSGVIPGYGVVEGVRALMLT